MQYWDNFEPSEVEQTTLFVWEGLCAFPQRGLWKHQRWRTSETLQQMWTLGFGRSALITFKGKRHAEWIEEKWWDLATIPVSPSVYHADENDLRSVISYTHWIKHIIDPDIERATFAWGPKGHWITPDWEIS